jgi:hypothetical protein
VKRTSNLTGSLKTQISSNLMISNKNLMRSEMKVHKKAVVKVKKLRKAKKNKLLELI